MANYLLKPVYRSVFGEEFRPDQFEDRLKMQKAIYLLENMGISAGDYGFMWYKHGPYSQTLQDDILCCRNLKEEKTIHFSADAQKEIAALRKAVSKEGIHYPQFRWIECLASMQYIKTRILLPSAGKSRVLEELKKRKPFLNNNEDNETAWQTLQELAI